MSDQQVFLLQQILEAVQEQTAANRIYRNETVAVQQTALAAQRKIARLARVVFVFLLASMAVSAAMLANWGFR